MSKFEYANFYGGFDNFAVNKEKFTKEQAIEMYKEEVTYLKEKNRYIAIGEGFVRHRAGVNEDGEACVGWWLEYSQHKRSCPAWVFHTSFGVEECFKNYEYIKFE